MFVARVGAKRYMRIIIESSTQDIGYSGLIAKDEMRLEVIQAEGAELVFFFFCCHRSQIQIANSSPIASRVVFLMLIKFLSTNLRP